MNAIEIRNKAENIAKSLSKISTTQIRNLFGRVKNLENKWKKSKKKDVEIYNQILLLKPKLAYIGKKNNVEVFKEKIEEIIDDINVYQLSESLEEFFATMEAIVCYHYVENSNLKKEAKNEVRKKENN